MKTMTTLCKVISYLLSSRITKDLEEEWKILEVSPKLVCPADISLVEPFKIKGSLLKQLDSIEPFATSESLASADERIFYKIHIKDTQPDAIIIDEDSWSNLCKFFDGDSLSFKF